MLTFARYIFLCLWVGWLLPGHAQRVGFPARKFSNQPLQLFFREAVVSYDWPIHRRVGLTGAVGYRYRNPSAINNELGGTGFGSVYELKPMFNPHYQAVKVAFGPTFYLTDSRSFYLQAEYFFRHWWVDNERIQFEPERGAGFDAFRTEWINVYGLKVLAGVSGYITNSSSRTPITFSSYAGIGFRAKTYWYESRNGTVNNIPVAYMLEQGHAFLPTLHAGLLLGFGFDN